MCLFNRRWNHHTVTRWWFQTFFIFTPIWGKKTFWLIFFKGVETTSVNCSEIRQDKLRLVVDPIIYQGFSTRISCCYYWSKGNVWFPSKGPCWTFDLISEGKNPSSHKKKPSLWRKRLYWRDPGSTGGRVISMEPRVVWVVVSNICYLHPYLGNISNLTNIFQGGWNHQLGKFYLDVVDICLMT